MISIAEYSIHKKVITLTLTFLIVLAGIIAYCTMSRLEDPEFTIKEALVITNYPGASAQEVANEVSNKLEKAIQQLGQLRRVTSRSMRGQSIITVVIKDKYDKRTLPQVWDELRRKVNDVQAQLPSGSQPSIILDDYSDVYGMFFAITGDGYSYAELKEVAKALQRELLLCKDVKKIDLWGVQDEAIYAEMSREKMAALGISPIQIYSLLAQKNLVGNAGNVKIGREYLPVTPTGGITRFSELGNLLISKDNDRLIFLKDVTTIKRGYIDPPANILHYNGKPAIGIAASTVLGGNAVNMGDDILRRLAELKPDLPLGVEIHPISLQSETVKSAVKHFGRNVVEAVLIVTILLLIFMGMRSGMLIGLVLGVTVAGTLVIMKWYGISLERISLGALIIALGMLVDNAIVVTEGMMVRIQKGENKLLAARQVVEQTKWPLLGATVISIFAFAAIGTSQDSSGEFCGSLFWVMLISLTFSWITAVTLTPLLCYYAFDNKNQEEKPHDPYDTRLFRGYRCSLEICLRYRKLTIAVMVGLLALSIFGFSFVDKTFFPPSTRPQFMVEVWLPAGTHIRETEKVAESMSKYVAKQAHVSDISSFVGGGSTRFFLSYQPEKNDPSYALLLVNVDDPEVLKTLPGELQKQMEKDYDNCLINVKLFQQGPGNGGKVQARVSGRDPQILRQIGDQILTIMRHNPSAKAVRSDWREKIKSVKPVFAEEQAKRLGITYQDLCYALMENFDGLQVGAFREGDEMLAIIARPPEEIHNNIKTMNRIFLWSNQTQCMIPVGQVVNTIETAWENPIVMRRHRLPTLTVHSDPRTGVAETLLNELRPKIEAIKLPPGYFIEWGGEYEDTNDAQGSLANGVPFCAIMMILMVVLLFNSIKHTLVIWLTVPLTIIGVTVGLLLFHQPFGFMALLGFFSLSGMQIRNAIVLLDEINHETGSGKIPYQAILDSSVSRIRPVCMAAFATVLGMAPLLKDTFFIAMAVTVMFGLSFACILTLYVVPVLYSLLFHIPVKKNLPDERTNGFGLVAISRTLGRLCIRPFVSVFRIRPGIK